MSEKALAMHGKLHQVDILPILEKCEWRSMAQRIQALVHSGRRRAVAPEETEEKAELSNHLLAAGILTRVR